MQLRLANCLANRIGSPALKGFANAVSNRICLAARNDRAFSLVTMASSNAGPGIASGAAAASAASDPESAGACARPAQSGLSGVGFMMGGCSATCSLLPGLTSLDVCSYSID